MIKKSIYNRTNDSLYMWRKVIISTKTKVMKLVEKSFPKCNGLGKTSKYSSIVL